MTSTHASYYLSQKVEIMERETPEASEIREAYSRAGIVLLICRVENGIWTRKLQEYIPTSQFLIEAFDKPSIPRDDLLEQHKKWLTSRRLHFGLQTSMIVTSDLLNKTNGIPAVDHHAPLPYETLYLPTLIPSLPEREIKPGLEWKGSLPVGFGLAEFRAAYTAKLKRVVKDNPEIEVTFDGPPPPVHSRGITLAFQLAGTWTVVISSMDGAPVSAKGQMHFKARGQQEEKGEMVLQGEVLDCSVHFELNRIPISFDEKNVYPGPWRPPPPPRNQPTK